MTGYARAQGSDERRRWVWEARSVNGRNLEIRCRVPPGFDRLENPARTAIGNRMKRGNVSLVTATTIDPLLDFAATTNVQGTTIEVDITGSSRAPKIELTSSPQLPQDEAMALLLFGKPSSSLSPMELLSAAQALAELTGKQPVGGGFLAKLRGGLGLDQLSINSGGSGSGSNKGTTTSVEGGRYVAPGVYVGARQGASADSSRGVVEWEVFRHTKVEGDIGADSNGKVGVKMEWDY